MCGGKDIWMTPQKGRDSSYLWLNWFSHALIERYCCLSCGFVATYIAQADFDDAAKMQRVRDNYTKV